MSKAKQTEPEAAEPKIKSRIKELRYVKASDLHRHPQNWRIHPENQESWMRDLLGRVGWADALVCAESPDGLLILDGHLRADLSGMRKSRCW